MRPLLCLFVLLSASLVQQSFSQSGAVIPEKAAAGHAEKPSCVLLKRMGPADQVTSRLYSFGIRGKQFQYIEGKLPEGFPFHGRMTDHDVRNLQARGAEVFVLNQNYTPDELKQARADCQGVTGKSPNLAEQTPASTITPASMKVSDPGSAPVASPASASAATTPPSGALTDLEISSAPSGADIEIDGKFVGSTPSSISTAPGDHEIVVKKKGFAPWTRKLTTSGGHIHVSAELTK